MKTLKNRLALLLLFFLVINFCKASDTLFYTVRNVSTTWSSSKNQKSNSTEDIKKYLSESERSSSKTEDLFLVPTIIEYIGGSTDFKYIMKIDENDTKKTYDNASLIIIAINKFNTLLEYQFYLFEKKHGQTSRLAEASFFIDPNSDDYQNKIQNQVQKLFKDHHTTNKAPIARIRLDNELIGAIDTSIYYRTTTESIVLDGTSSIDDNTPKKYFIYKWSVRKDGDSNAFIPNFNFEKGRQKLLLPETGVYEFRLKISDGIEYSKEEATVKIRVIKPLNIEILHKPAIFRQSPYSDWKRPLVDSLGFVTNRDFPQGTFLEITYLHSLVNSEKNLFLKNYSNLKPITIVLLNDSLVNKKNTLGENKDYSFTGGIRFADTVNSNAPHIFYSPDLRTTGIHLYTVKAKYNGVNSNIDTLRIDYRIKRPYHILAGISTNTVVYLEPSNTDTTIYMTAANYFGFYMGYRAYFKERLALEQVISYVSNQSGSVPDDIPTSLFKLALGLNVDILPFSRLKLISSQTDLVVSGILNVGWIGYSRRNLGIQIFDPYFELGGRGRIQLFKAKPKVGYLQLEGQLSFSSAPKFKLNNNDGAFMINFGFGFVYGWYK